MLEKSAAGSLMFCKWCPYRIEERKKKYHLLWGENEWWSCTLKKSLRRCIHRFLSGIHIETSPHWSCFIEPSRLRRCSESYRHKKRAPNSNTHRWIIEDSSPHVTDHIWPPHRCQHCMKLKRVWRWERQSIIDHRESSRIIQSNQSKAPNQNPMFFGPCNPPWASWAKNCDDEGGVQQKEKCLLRRANPCGDLWKGRRSGWTRLWSNIDLRRVRY